MKIRSTNINNFMMIEDAEFEWSPNVNIICGENSTGKTTLLKLLYSLAQPLGKNGFSNRTKDETEKVFINKMIGVFRPDENKIGRLVNRKQGSSRAEFAVDLGADGYISAAFGNKQENHADMIVNVSAQKKELHKKFEAVYIPTKEMISTTAHFASLYEEYELDFEEMYYDLSKLLSKPLSKGANTKEQRTVLSRFEEIMQGEIVQKDKKFFLKVKGKGEFEMGLVSDGFRKLSTIIYLILSGSLTKDAMLFWDEPETNMNPKMIRPIVQAIMELAKMGVQVFVTTHDYFVIQEFNMYATYPEINSVNLQLNFYSLFLEEDRFSYDIKSEISELKINAIMEEFDAIYDREQEIIYGTK